jgi:hypothetical protein
MELLVSSLQTCHHHHYHNNTPLAGVNIWLLVVIASIFISGYGNTQYSTKTVTSSSCQHCFKW